MVLAPLGLFYLLLTLTNPHRWAAGGTGVGVDCARAQGGDPHTDPAVLWLTTGLLVV